MTTKELVSLNPKKVRHNNDLMQLYIQKFEAAFSYKPNCAGCTFSNDFNKLKKHVQSGAKTIVNLKPKTMESYKIKQKYRHQILTYTLNKRPYRTYGRNMSDQFAKDFLTYGTKQQLEERKKMFDVIPTQKEAKDAKKPIEPKTKDSTPNEAEEVKLTDRMSRKKLDEIALQQGLNPDDYDNKKELIAALTK